MGYNKDIVKLNDKAKQYKKKLDVVISEMSNVIVGKEKQIKKLLIALVANGHVLMEGVPGLAKTLMIQTLSDSLNAGFVRLQFTPDLLPADIVGTKIYNQKISSFRTVKGPIFTNFVLADEINRAPPKVQSALLEAMQERQVSIQGETYDLDKPFLVLATQNPIESEGTYNLPEAQVDRFMFKVILDYPDLDEEQIIIQRFTKNLKFNVKRCMNTKEIVDIQKFCREVYADEKIEGYVARIVSATRDSKNFEMNGYIEYGASPRASIWLILGAKANAILNGRGYVVPDDVKEVAYEVLRHRIILTFEAEAEDVTTDMIIKKILDKVKF